MTQTLDSLPADCADRILCCYINDAHKIKIARISNIPSWYFERVVFPGERLLFEALPQAQLEIYVTNFSTVSLVEMIGCDRLAIRSSSVIEMALSSNKKIFRARQITALRSQHYSSEKSEKSVSIATWGEKHQCKDIP
ncbi:MAG TPA: DUF1830 domain-containing protein [Thermosynechococcaceae cyanobacterium]